MNETISIEEWRASLPKDTTVLSCKETIYSTSGIVKILRANITT